MKPNSVSEAVQNIQGLLDEIKKLTSVESANNSGAEAPELRHSAEVVELPAGAGALEAEAVRAMMRTPFRLAERAVNRELEAFQILMRIARSQRHMITIGRGHRLNDWDIIVYRDGRVSTLRVPYNGSFLGAMQRVRFRMVEEAMDDGIHWQTPWKDGME